MFKGVTVSGCDTMAACQQACRDGKVQICLRLADGWLAAGDDEKAHVLHQAACLFGAPNDCLMIGKAYANGYGVKPDLLFASQLYSVGCSLPSNSPPDCEKLAPFHKNQKALFDKYCLAAAVASPATAFQLPGGVMPLWETDEPVHLVSSADPKYPDIALNAGIGGWSYFRILIDPEGKVREVTPIRASCNMFLDVGRSAISMRKYSPPHDKGISVWFYRVIQIDYAWRQDNSTIALVELRTVHRANFPSICAMRTA